ncbi:MAG: hypothetical protein ACOCPM_00740 [Bacteroidales bacterium]
MKHYFTLFVFLFAAFTASSQKPLIKGEFEMFFTDALGHFYTVEDNTIRKYDTNGNPLQEYSDLTSGDISWVDVSNPHKILVYYKTFDQIIFLDKYLSPSSDIIDLTDYNILSSSVVARSYDNGIWVFDPSAGELIRMDESMNISHRSGSVLWKSYEDILYAHQVGEYVILVRSGQVLVFDKFASFMKMVPLPKTSIITWAPQSILYLNNKTLKKYNFITHQESKMDWSDSEPKQIRYRNQKLFYLTGKGIFQAEL